jgi:glycoprotein endo-alpha-1,2-mannosidase
VNPSVAGRWFLLVCAVLAGFVAIGAEPAPREVLAFYYPWYGEVNNGRARHWNKVDADNHEISDSTHYPLKGAYSSRDPEVIDWHMDLAKTNGVTGFIASWWGQGSPEDRVIPILLERAQVKHFKVTVYWEKVPGKKGEDQIDRGADDLVYLLTHYGTNSAFLKVGGKPVIFVYGRAMNEVPVKDWAAIRDEARAKAGDFLLVADGYAEKYGAAFDGFHAYNICGDVKGKSPEELRTWAAGYYGNAVKFARQRSAISAVTVIPGYDDTKIRKPGLKADRLNGQVYRTLWDEAIRSKPDWVLITSWNEWHEGSEIEPSLEDGDKYIRMTGEMAAKFRPENAGRN